MRTSLRGKRGGDVRAQPRQSVAVPSSRGGVSKTSHSQTSCRHTHVEGEPTRRERDSEHQLGN